MTRKAAEPRLSVALLDSRPKRFAPLLSLPIMSDPSWWARTRRWLTVAPLVEVLSGWTKQLIGGNNKGSEEPDNPDLEDPPPED